VLFWASQLAKGWVLLKFKDFDPIRWPDMSGGQVFSAEDVMSSCRPLTKEQVIEMFADVFEEGLGLLGKQLWTPYVPHGTKRTR